MKQLLFIYGYFGINALVMNFYRIYQCVTCVELDYQTANDMWNASLMIAMALSWPAFYFLNRWKILPFDFWDEVIILICFFYAMIDAMDWFWNFNMRSDLMDWVTFIFISFVIVGVKMYFNRQNTKAR